MARPPKGKDGLDLGGFLARFGAALVLVFASYNPSGWSYFHWLSRDGFAIDPLKALAGIVLIIGWVVFIRATMRSLGWLGLVLAAAFFGTLIWLVVDLGWVPAGSVEVLTYLIMVALCAVLATGMSWSHVRARLTGQRDVDEVDG
jgi:hypothetical protein